MLTLDSIPQPNAAVQGRRLETEAVLVWPAKGEVKVLNDVGASIWQLLDSQRTVREIVQQICREYAVSATEAEADALSFLKELADRGLVTIRA